MAKTEQDDKQATEKPEKAEKPARQPKAHAAEAGAGDAPAKGEKLPKGEGAEGGSEGGDKPAKAAKAPKAPKGEGAPGAPGAEEGEGGERKAGPRKKKIKRTITAGKVFIQSTYNNTIVSITDQRGNVVAWSSAGNVGFKGSRKSTPYAAGLAADSAVKKAMELGLQTVDVYFRGPGAGKDAAVRMIQSSKLKVGIIKDIASAPHNGCRPPKRRRV
jgi:small subunit ribosomal protein S11